MTAPRDVAWSLIGMAGLAVVVLVGSFLMGLAL